MVSEAGKNLEHTVPVKGHCQKGTRCFSLIPFWGFIVLIEALTSSSTIDSSKRRRRWHAIKCLISGRKAQATKDVWAACLALIFEACWCCWSSLIPWFSDTFHWQILQHWTSWDGSCSDSPWPSAILVFEIADGVKPVKAQPTGRRRRLWVPDV